MTSKLDYVFYNNPIFLTLDIEHNWLEKLTSAVNFGLSAIAINTLNEELFNELFNRFPEVHFGASNIINADQLEVCHKIGLTFVTSPGFMPTLVQTADIYNINYLPGVSTISEAMQAHAWGCQRVRPFPATLNLCQNIHKALPNLQLFPGDVEWHEKDLFLNIPSVTSVSVSYLKDE